MPSRPNVSKKREEVNPCPPLSVVSVKFFLARPAGSRSSTDCSTAASASSVRQRCERFHPTISRVQQSITHTRYAASPRLAPPRFSSWPTARSDSDRLLLHSTPLFLPSCSKASRTHQQLPARASPAARACDSPEDFLSFAATKSRGDIRYAVPFSPHAMTICSS